MQSRTPVRRSRRPPPRRYAHRLRTPAPGLTPAKDHCHAGC